MKFVSYYFITLVFLISVSAHAQDTKDFNVTIKYSNLTATYNFIQKLSDYYPDNTYKAIFNASKYNTPQYLDLIAQLDTLDLYKSLSFEGYPYGQKLPLQTISLIEKHLLNSDSIESFTNQAFGIISNDQFFAFTNIIRSFEPIFNELIYLPNRMAFDNKIKELADFVSANNISHFFKIGLNFYGTNWNSSVPIDIAIIPSIDKAGFTATAFMNNAVSEVPLDFKHNDILFSVLLHEIFHLQFDGQPLHLKQSIHQSFSEHSSVNRQYAYLLFDEALATALGNGYVYEQFNKALDTQDWYNVKYINLMAQKIYPLVKEYIENKKPIDQYFINQYIKLYDENFSHWPKELNHILTYRYILTDNRQYAQYFRRAYRYAGRSVRSLSFDELSLDKMKETPITKVVIISEDNAEKLQLLKATFDELSDWSFLAEEEFVHVDFLNDKTSLIIVNIIDSNLKEIFERTFIDKKLP